MDNLLNEVEEGSEAAPKPEAKPAAEAKEESEEAEAPAEEAPKAEAKEESEEAEAPAEEDAEAKSEEPTEDAAEPAGDEESKADADEAEGDASAETAPAPKADDVKPAESDEELLANVLETERLRRKALDVQAKREITSARECMERKEFLDAVDYYDSAAKLLNDRESSKKLRKECAQGAAEGLYRAAIAEDALGRREAAVELMLKARDRRHPKALRMLERWTAEASAAESEIEDKTAVGHRRHDSDYQQKREQIRRHLKRSREYLGVKDLTRALEECEIVLVNDPYNREAIRLRKRIEAKRLQIHEMERNVAHEGMIADVDEKWRPVYAVNAEQINETVSETVKVQGGEDPERTLEQEIEDRMKAMRLPTVSFKPPATIIEAVDFFRQASKDYDDPEKPVEKRGFNFVLKTPQPIKTDAGAEEASDDFSNNTDEAEEATKSTNGLDPIPTITASDITFYEALKLVCDSVDYKFIVRGPVVMVMHKDMSTAELLSRKYNVPEAFVERVNSASDEIKEMGGFGGSSKKGSSKRDSDAEAGPEQNWQAFFEEMGVKWPEGSSIKHIKALGKLYVRNTRENLAEFEKVLDELGGQPQLIEIETRFVEVAQEDLNSLGFEWILNNNLNVRVNNGLGNALGIRKAQYAPYETDPLSTQTTTVNADGTISVVNTGSTSSSSDSGTYWQEGGDTRNIGVAKMGGDSDYGTGQNRYLSTTGNHISGTDSSYNDQFMRVNAFLGSADLSMILHMLSQRSDTDMLSAPKVVTKSGEEAVIKVVTEYIYPQDYDVQLQSSSSSSSSSTSSGSSSILAIVEPQNFTMREVGVILDVTPTYSEANGGTIDLELKPQVVGLECWQNYGMEIPFSGNTSLQNFEGIGGIFDGLSSIFEQLGTAIPNATKAALADQAMDSASSALEGLTTTAKPETYEAKMEQPFFHVRSVDSKVSITPGSTVVMGGLITETRKAMDDKIPFLGDLPYLGRLFRSHAESTSKRNLLIFVTGRLITPSGRELRTNEQNASSDAEVKEAPKAE